MAFDADTTTDQVLQGIDLSGTRAVVTGASGGLGEETARALASKGAAVTLVARDAAKGAAAVARIRAAVTNAKIDVGEMDLASPASVRAFASHWLKANSKLDVLLNNAGIMCGPLARNELGWEMQLATNHLGHFLLTCLLAPALAKGARVVNLSSGGHWISGIDFTDPHYEKRAYEPWPAYGQSKTANILFSIELNRRLAPRGITVNAVHPGTIQTDLGRRLTQDDYAWLQSRVGAGGLKYKSIPAGAATSVWAATSADLAGKGGLYLEDCRIGQAAPHASSAEDAARLWAMSEKALGQTLPLT